MSSRLRFKRHPDLTITLCVHAAVVFNDLQVGVFIPCAVWRVTGCCCTMWLQSRANTLPAFYRPLRASISFSLFSVCLLLLLMLCFVFADVLCYFQFFLFCGGVGVGGFFVVCGGCVGVGNTNNTQH